MIHGCDTIGLEHDGRGAALCAHRCQVRRDLFLRQSRDDAFAARPAGKAEQERFLSEACECPGGVYAFASRAKLGSSGSMDVTDFEVRDLESPVDGEVRANDENHFGAGNVRTKRAGLNSRREPPCASASRRPKNRPSPEPLPSLSTR